MKEISRNVRTGGFWERKGERRWQTHRTLSRGWLPGDVCNVCAFSSFVLERDRFCFFVAGDGGRWGGRVGGGGVPRKKQWWFDVWRPTACCGGWARKGLEVGLREARAAGEAVVFSDDQAPLLATDCL